MSLSENDLRSRVLPQVQEIRDRLRSTLAALNTTAVMRAIPPGERLRLAREAKASARAEAHRFKAVVEAVSNDAGRVIQSILTEIEYGRDAAAEKADYIKAHGHTAYLDHQRAERKKLAGAVEAAAEAILRAHAARKKPSPAPRVFFPDSAA
jgi:hypothetical protein